MPAPGKSLLEHWFCPRFQTKASTGRAVGASATRWRAIRGTLAVQRLPPWHLELEEVMSEHSLLLVQDKKKGVWGSSVRVLKKARWQRALNWLTYTPYRFPLNLASVHPAVLLTVLRQTSKKTFWIPLCKWLYLALMKEWIWWPSKSSLTHDTVILHGCVDVPSHAWIIQPLSCSVPWEAKCVCQGSCSMWDLTPKEEGILFPWTQNPV